MKTKKLLITLVIAMFFTSFTALAQAPAIDWQKSLGGSNADVAICTKQTPDGGYIVTGLSNSEDGDIFVNHGGNDFWVTKLDVDGVIQWSNSFGGTKNDEAYFITITSDGGYIVAGLSYSDNGDATVNHGDADYWIVKINNIGNLQWQKSYGGSGYDKINSIEETSDGGYIVAGYSGSTDGDVTGNHGKNDYWILKIQSDGAISWQKSLGGSDNEKAYSVKETADGGYIVFGFTGSMDGDITNNHGGFDYWVTKINSIGNLEWQKTYGGTQSDIGAVIALDVDGYILTGQSESYDGDATFNNGGYDYWTLKIDFDGSILWQKSYGGSADDIAYSVGKTTGNGYVISGYSESNNGDVTGNHGMNDVWVVKLHSDGSFNWELSLGGSTTDGSAFIEQTADGGYIATCTANSIDGDVTGNHGGFDYWIVKLDADLATSLTSVQSKNSQIYPNPFQDFIVLPHDTKNYEITNEFGKVISNKVFNNMVNTEELPPGVYFAEITLKDGSKTVAKLIKQ